jgi:uncharacterized protein (TIRG00374 family)
MRAWLRFAAMLVAFAALTALGLWWAAPPSGAIERSLRELVALGPVAIAVLCALAIAVVAAELLRFFVIGRALGVRVSARAALDATIANNLMTWISPGGLLGEPAAVYMLGRRGVAWDAALVICFGKFATSFAFIMGLACVLLALGYGPHIAAWAVAPIAATVGLGVVLIGTLVVGAIWPAAAHRRIDAIEARLLRWLPRAGRPIAAAAREARSAIDRLAGFGRSGAPGRLAILASHVVYYGAYVGLLVALAAIFGARGLAGIIPLAIIYQAFTYIAPAPGIPEAGAAAFFGGLMPDGDAFVVVLLFRALTAYFQVVLGLVYLPIVGALRGLLRKRREPLG